MKNIYAEVHPNLCAIYAAHRLYSAFFAFSFNTAPVSISFSRLIMVLQMMLLSETVVILKNHKAWDTEVKLPLIQ